MTQPTAGDERARRAVLADVRQRLNAPVEALVGYAELISAGVDALGLASSAADAEKVLVATRELGALVNRLLDEETAGALFADRSPADAGKGLRHDLRTPINAIKGYGEMLLEDAHDAGAEALGEDLRRLLAESDRLLAQLGSIVDFSRTGASGASGAIGEMSADAAALAELIAESPRPGDGPLPSGETGFILVVDDIESNRDLLSRRLVADGHRVAIAAGGEEALAMLRTDDFDLVLLDVMMPGMNGFQVLAEIKRNPDLKGFAGGHGVGPRRDRHRHPLHRGRRRRLPAQAHQPDVVARAHPIGP